MKLKLLVQPILLAVISVALLHAPCRDEGVSLKAASRKAACRRTSAGRSGSASAPAGHRQTAEPAAQSLMPGLYSISPRVALGPQIPTGAAESQSRSSPTWPTDSAMRDEAPAYMRDAPASIRPNYDGTKTIIYSRLDLLIPTCPALHWTSGETQ